MRFIGFMAAAAGVLFSGCGGGAGGAPQAGGKAAEEAPISVEVLTVEKQPVPVSVLLTGSLAANEDSNVAADVNGKIARVHVERGAFVKSGQPIAQVDLQSLNLTASEAGAQVKSLEAQLSSARADCERTEQLFKENAVSSAQRDRVLAQCTALEQSLEAARARAGQAGKMLRDGTIRAPFDGVIVERMVSVGEYVQPSTAVVRLVAIDPMRLELTVPEAALPQVREGQKIDFQVTAFPGESFTAEVKFVAGAVRKNSRDLVVEAVLANPEGKLRPGMFALAKLHTGESQLPVVPRSAVRRDERVSRVFVVENGRVRETLVQLQPDADGERLPVVAGLAGGEKVVANVSDSVKDGVRVQ